MEIWSATKRNAGHAIRRLAPSLWIRLALLTRNHNLEPELWCVPLLLGDHKVAIDVGANEGIWSLQLARYATDVHAFEPNPICVEQLTSVLPRNVRLHQTALSHSRGSAQLRFDPGNTGLGTIEANNPMEENPDIKSVVSVAVEAATIDSFFFGDVGLIKIDVEGHEEAVLSGTEETLRRERPVFIIEIEERHNGGGLGRILGFFEREGYESIALHDGRLRKLEEIKRNSPVSIAAATGINNFIFVDKERAPEILARSPSI
jgi:FkbM family methyltransferase